MNMKILAPQQFFSALLPVITAVIGLDNFCAAANKLNDDLETEPSFELSMKAKVEA